MINPMKDSGVEWIGEIPSDWTVTRLKFITKGNLQYGANAEGIDYDERLPRYIRITDIDSNNNLKDSGKQSLQVIIAKPYILKKGDLLFARSGATVGKTFLFQSDTLSAFAGYLIKYSPIESIESRFIYYMTLGNGYDNWKNSIFSQSTIQNIGADKYGNLPVALPCKKNEQKAIANFLDEETKKLDDVKSLLQQQIEKLKEYRKSLIWETVTKGLDKTVPMKDSGLNWIGEIPEGWKISKIKYTTQLNGRIGWQGLTSSEYQNEGPFLITGTDFQEGRINFESAVHIEESRWSEAKQIQVENGDLLITKDGTVGKVAIIDGLDDKASLNSGVLRIQTTDEVNRKFLYYVLLSEEFWLWFNYTNSGASTILHLYQNVFDRFTYVIPQIEEQESIINFLDKKTFIIEEIISNTQSQIEIIDKQKKTLIYDYVTGKRRVKL